MQIPYGLMKIKNAEISARIIPEWKRLSSGEKDV